MNRTKIAEKTKKKKKKNNIKKKKKCMKNREGAIKFNKGNKD